MRRFGLVAARAVELVNRTAAAIAAELFWGASESKEKILDRVLSRRFVE